MGSVASNRKTLFDRTAETPNAEHCRGELSQHYPGVPHCRWINTGATLQLLRFLIPLGKELRGALPRRIALPRRPRAVVEHVRRGLAEPGRLRRRRRRQRCGDGCAYVFSSIYSNFWLILNFGKL